MTNSTHFFRMIGAVLVLLATASAQGADIPWLDDKVFEHRSVNEPVEEVLGQILDQNQLRGIFLPGVKAKKPISASFEGEPLEAAFNKVVQEAGLSL